jgi:hypothetical protein
MRPSDELSPMERTLFLKKGRRRLNAGLNVVLGARHDKESATTKGDSNPNADQTDIGSLKREVCSDDGVRNIGTFDHTDGVMNICLLNPSQTIEQAPVNHRNQHRSGQG